MDADDLAGDVEVLHLRARLAQTVQGSWSLPPMRIRDLVFPGVDVGAGRMIGGGSLGRTPEAMSSRIWRGGRRQSWGSEPWIPLLRPLTFSQPNGTSSMYGCPASSLPAVNREASTCSGRWCG